MYEAAPLHALPHPHAYGASVKWPTIPPRAQPAVPNAATIRCREFGQPSVANTVTWWEFERRPRSLPQHTACMPRSHPEPTQSNSSLTTQTNDSSTTATQAHINETAIVEVSFTVL